MRSCPACGAKHRTRQVAESCAHGAPWWNPARWIAFFYYRNRPEKKEPEPAKAPIFTPFDEGSGRS